MVARRLPAAGLEVLRERFEVDEGELDLDSGRLIRRAAGADALIADPTVPVDGGLLDAAGPGLRIVANFAVGHDNVDLAACRERGVAVTNTPDVLTNATAELAVALMLATARRLGESERLLRAGHWTGWDPGALLGLELAHGTVGIVGLGRIGSRVAELLSGFGSRMLYEAKRPRPALETSLGLERRKLTDLVAESDVVTLHVSLDADTRHLVNAALLKRFKPGSILINTSRGAVVDTIALVAALSDGRLAGAGLDVYEDEPAVPAELIALESVVLLPHIGSATDRARNAMARLAADNVVAVLEGGEPLTPVV